MNNLQERKDRFDTMLAEGRVLRNKWTSTNEGKERACLLAAWSPEVGREERAGACPSWLMPAWLAELTPWMDDNGSNEAWPAFATRYGDMVWAARVLDAAAWDRAFKVSLKLIVADAMASKDKAAKSAKSAKSALSALSALSAVRSAKSAAESAEYAVRFAESAAEYAKSAAESAEYAAKSAEYAAKSAAKHAVDRISAGILGAIEAECKKEKKP